MALLSEAARETLLAIERAKQMLENRIGELNNLLREVYRRDSDEVGLNPATETGADLLARAKAAYVVKRGAIVAAANSLPEL